MPGRGKVKPGDQNKRVHLQAMESTICMRLGLSECGLKQVFSSALTRSPDLVTCAKCKKKLVQNPQLYNRLQAEKAK